jgi:arachidonate 15-lipoxygenase
MVYLPQNDPNPNGRKQRLQQQRELYEYDYSKLDDYPTLKPARFPLVQQVPEPDESFTKGGWIKDALSLGLRIRANQGLQDLSLKKFVRVMRYFLLSLLIADPDLSGFWRNLFKKFSPLFNFLIRLRNRRQDQAQETTAPPNSALRNFNKFQIEQIAKSILEQPSQTVSQAKQAQVTGTSPASYQNFSDFQPKLQPYRDLFQLVYIPEISKYFQFDHAFAAQRVAGVNPLVIHRVTQPLPAHFPVSADNYRQIMGDGDSLETAIADGRLYLADYKILETIPTPTIFPENPEDQANVVTKYGYAPLALFAVPAGTAGQRALTPIAIQCGQDPSKYPLFTPKSGQWDWLIAKTIVQIADGNHHELISHLGRTHFFLESFAISTPRQLAPNHPLYLLLTPHFEGTLFINDSALRGLVNKGGTVDKVLFGRLEDSLRVTVGSIRSTAASPFDFDDLMLPKALQARGVDDPTKLPVYPYRDDALELWAAIHAWAKSYVELYYATDAEVQADTELQAWCQELIATGENGGQVVGFGELDAQGQRGLRTRAYLINAVTLLIFTGSVQHAAVNFPQAPYMTFGPNMPLAGYQKDAGTRTDTTAEDYLALLPPLTQADAQMSMTYVLGSVYYTQLGNYDREPDKEYFSGDSRVKPLLINFQQHLQEIERNIEKHNEQRPIYYDALLPNKIPQSINI